MQGLRHAVVRIVALLFIRKRNQLQPPMLVRECKIHRPGHVAKYVFGYHHVSFEWFRYRPRQLVNGLQDFIARRLFKVHYAVDDSLEMPLLLRLVQRQLFFTPGVRVGLQIALPYHSSSLV